MNYSANILFFNLLLATSSALGMDALWFKGNSRIFAVYQEMQSESNHVVIPLKRAGNLLLIDAKVDSIEGTFILDTGVPGLVLNSTYFRDGRETFDGHGAGISGQKILRQTKRIKAFSFSGLEFQNVKAEVISLAHIENSKGVKILGLIGTSFMRDFETSLDIRNLSLMLSRVDKKGNLIEPRSAEPHFDFSHKVVLVNNVMVTYMSIGGISVCFCLDTGAEHTVIDPSNPNKVMQEVSITRRSYITGTSSERIEVLYGYVSGIHVAGHQLKPMQVMVADLSNMRAGFSVNIRGMLGFGFFEQGLVRINLRKKTMQMELYKQEE